MLRQCLKRSVEIISWKMHRFHRRQVEYVWGEVLRVGPTSLKRGSKRVVLSGHVRLRQATESVISRIFDKGGQTCTFRTCTLFFVKCLHCLTLLEARDCPLSFTECGSKREEGGGEEGMEGRREVVLRPKIWQRTKCTFEKCTFVPS